MGVEISELNEATSVQSSDVLPIVQNGETKKITKENLFNDTETEIENLEASKVNKTGDTLTGFLDFENKDEFHAFLKTRTLNGTDYQVAVGVGGNNSARMECVQNNNVLSSVEARDDGRIWNGKTNRNLPEVAYCGWQSSFTFTMRGGHALVMLNAGDVLSLWVGGSYPSQTINITRLAGTDAQVSFNAQNQTVTVNFANNRNFTCTAFIGI